MRGFEPASGLLQDRIRKAGETRGFAISRLLTHWAEIVGQETADCTRPVKMGYSREGIGASLSLFLEMRHTSRIPAHEPKSSRSNAALPVQVLLVDAHRMTRDALASLDQRGGRMSDLGECRHGK